MDPEQNTGAPAQNTAPQKSSALWIGAAVLLLVVIAWFMLMKGTDEAMPDGSGAPVAGSTIGADAQETALSSQGTSDEVADIEADLNATDLNSLNEIDQI